MANQNVQQMNKDVTEQAGSPKRAVIYVRSATGGKVNGRDPLMAQLDECWQYAHEHGFQVMAQVQDMGSGAFCPT